ncbi:uncharacterized protein SPAPADRAFT_61717 [Spathaspora passalidarum NRRL Y-27907]|uniref:E set domain-containing protein n=1 Tax=Spathaspora passalidarum (strain NRRL Y-27907 / 11-Y1) TaxID=619300 RepID=G3AP81_SPAPN|nr:uncharacterized protein SPAPADRAFT_61717 [Spathaspora passalidarum NRRL Y-27907]EGW32652.1 hypothetical protein SPAPADRAFT_61717 [Spathaspora passalidarum NRRL Y-27907]
MVLKRHPDFEIIKFVLKVEGQDPVDVPVKDVDSIHIKIPGGKKYIMEMHFVIMNRKLENFRYIQVVKKAGITVRTREVEIGSYEPGDEVYVKKFPEDDSPGGFFSRGHYGANSTYYAGDEMLVSNDWTLEIVK